MLGGGTARSSVHAPVFQQHGGPGSALGGVATRPKVKALLLSPQKSNGRPSQRRDSLGAALGNGAD